MKIRQLDLLAFGPFTDLHLAFDEAKHGLHLVCGHNEAGKSSALVSSPDGLVSRIVVGNYLGQNYGQVTAVSQDKIELIEVVPDGLGAWIQRPASLAVAE